jgi:hypothetical protein
MSIEIDTTLIARAEALSIGTPYERSAKVLVSAYRAAYSFAIDSGLPSEIKVFTEAQKDLRVFVHQRIVDKTKPDVYDLTTNLPADQSMT